MLRQEALCAGEVRPSDRDPPGVGADIGLDLSEADRGEVVALGGPLDLEIKRVHLVEDTGGLGALLLNGGRRGACMSGGESAEATGRCDAADQGERHDGPRYRHRREHALVAAHVHAVHG